MPERSSRKGHGPKRSTGGRASRPERIKPRSKALARRRRDADRRAALDAPPPKSAAEKHGEELAAMALELWETIRREGGFASTHASKLYRDAKLSPGAKARVHEDLHAMLRLGRTIEYAFQDSNAPRSGPGFALARLWAARILTKRGTIAQAAELLPAVDWKRVFDVGLRIAAEADATRRFALSHSLPDAFAEALMEAYGDEAGALAAAFDGKAPLTLRANALKATRETVLGELGAAGLRAKATEYSPWGVRLPEGSDPYATAAFKEGRIEVQDEASQLVAELVAAAPGSLVIDACAGAGGKTLALGAWMKNKGVLIAADRHGTRLDELKRRARRAGLFCHRAVKADLLGTWPKELEELKGKAARVLVDAPCTGTGALRRNPEARLRLDGDELARLPEEQFRIARAAAALVKPNGRLIYATCSVLPAENERVAERLLADAELGLTIVPVAEILGGARAKKISDESGRYLKLLPHRHGTDGFFAAVLRRK